MKCFIFGSLNWLINKPFFSGLCYLLFLMKQLLTSLLKTVTKHWPRASGYAGSSTWLWNLVMRMALSTPKWYIPPRWHLHDFESKCKPCASYRRVSPYEKKKKKKVVVTQTQHGCICTIEFMELCVDIQDFQMFNSLLRTTARHLEILD